MSARPTQEMAVRHRRQRPRILLLAAAGIVLLVAMAVLTLVPEEPREPRRVPSLSISEERVRPGDVIELSVFAGSYIWGVPSSLEKRRDGEWEAIYHWATFPGKTSEPLEALPVEKVRAWPDIGLRGSASFLLEIPEVGLGVYRITIPFNNEESIIPAARLIVVS